jgi:HEPN domain-containing protein
MPEGPSRRRASLASLVDSRMSNRWKDWWSQAERDLEHARESAAAGRHEWACFAAHQAGEKAVKALHYGPLHSTQALYHANQILAFVRSRLA